MPLVKIADLPDDVDVDAGSLMNAKLGLGNVDVRPPAGLVKVADLPDELPEPTHTLPAGQSVPPGWHRMPDGSLMRDDEMPEPPTAGEQLTQGMEMARLGLGEAARGLERPVAGLPAPLRLPAQAVAGAVSLLPTLPQDAITAALFGGPKAAAGMAMRESERDVAVGHPRGVMERAGEAIPDIVAGYTPLAGPVYGIPALEQAEAGAREGQPKDVLLGLGGALLAGAGGVAEMGALASRAASRAARVRPEPTLAGRLVPESGKPPGWTEVEPNVWTPPEEPFVPGIGAGRPAARDAFKRALRDAGVDAAEMDGKSAKQLAEMMRSRGLDPREFPPTPPEAVTPREAAVEPIGPSADDIAADYQPTAAEPPTPKAAPPTLAPGSQALHPEYGQVKVLAEDAGNVLVEIRGKYGKKRAVYVAKTSVRPLSAEELATPYEPTPAEKAKMAAREPATMMESEAVEDIGMPEEVGGDFGPGLEQRAQRVPGRRGFFKPGTLEPVNPAEGEPMPERRFGAFKPTTGKAELLATRMRNQAFEVDGRTYEMIDERVGPSHAQAAMEQAAKHPAVAELVRFIEGVGSLTSNRVGELMRRIPGATPADEWIEALTAKFRGLTRFADEDLMGRSEPKWKNLSGGWTLDPWGEARYTNKLVDEGQWSVPEYTDLLTEPTRAAIRPFMTEARALPPELLARIKDELWLRSINETAVHEPLHGVTESGHMLGGMRDSMADIVTPDRFDIIWEAARNEPTVRNNEFVTAMLAPANARRLRAWREFFSTEPKRAAAGAPPKPPTTPPPPAGGPGGPATPPPPPQPPPGPPGGNPQLTPELKAKLSAALTAQRLGRASANSRNIVLHAKQAAIERSWIEKAQRGEISFVDARIGMMKDIDGLTAGIQDVTPAGFTAEEMQALLTRVNDKAAHNTFTWMRAANAVEDLQRGIQLQPNQLDLIRQVFGREALGEKPTWLRQMWEQMFRLGSAFRASVTSLDVSAPGRQALPATVGHPVLAARAFWKQLLSTFSDRQFQIMERQIEQNVYRDIQQAAGLHLAKRGHGMSIAAALDIGGAEERFMPNIAEKLPWVRGSERGYITYLNKLRSDLFNKMAETYIRRGIDFETHPHVFKDLAEAVNNMTGRGSLELFRVSPETGLGRAFGLSETWQPGRAAIEPAAMLLNSGFFAPRFMASRLALLRDLPLLYMNYSPPVRKLLLKDMFMTVGAGLAGLEVAAQLGSKVELDPRSSDFGKVRVGKTRIDPWGGFQPWVRFMAQFMTGERKSLRTGLTAPLGTAGQGGRLDLTYRFLEQKAAPLPGLALDLMRGKRATGEPLDTKFLHDEFPYVNRELWSRIAPMVIQDFQDVAAESSLELAFLTLPLSMVGMGVQTYDPSQPPTRRTVP